MGEPTQRATVVNVRQLSPFVRELVLAPAERALHFQPGQWVSLQLPVGDRPPLVRAYSMAEPASELGRLVLAFDRVPSGLGSEYLCGLRSGDSVTVSGPYGKFVLPEPVPHSLVFIAQYTGIVPIRCMLKYLFSARLTSSITLSYSAPSQAEMIYHDEFTALASSEEQFRYVWTISDLKKRASLPAAEWPEIKTLAPWPEERSGVTAMISGVKSFVHPLRAYLTELGVERREIKVETYD